MNKNQKGFSAIEVLVVVVVAGVIGLVGWYVWHQKNPSKVQTPKSQTSQNNSSTKSTPPPTANSANGNVIKIPDQGIQFTVPDSIKDLTYIIEEQTDYRGQKVVYIRLSTASLTLQDKSCTAAGSSIGVIAKGLGQYPVATESDLSPNEYYGSLVKQFPNFFITYEQTHAACSSNGSESPSYQATVDMQTAQMELIKQAISSVKPL